MKSIISARASACKGGEENQKPLARAFHEWMLLQRLRITEVSATAKALITSLKRWSALTKDLDDGRLLIDNNWIPYRIRQAALSETIGFLQGRCAPVSAQRP